MQQELEISQINLTRCTILFDIFIYLSSLRVLGVHAITVSM